MGHEVAQLALDEDEADRKPVEVEAEPEAGQRSMLEVTKIRLGEMHGWSGYGIHVGKAKLSRFPVDIEKL